MVSSNVCVLELPESTILEVQKQGITVLKEEAVILDALLAVSQKGLNVQDPASRQAWLEPYTVSLNELAKGGYTFSLSEAWAVATHATRITGLLKKTLSGSPTSSTPTTTVPSETSPSTSSIS